MDDAIRVGVGEGSQEHAIHRAEHRRRRTNAKRKRSDRDEREARLHTQRARRVFPGIGLHGLERVVFCLGEVPQLEVHVRQGRENGHRRLIPHQGAQGIILPRVEDPKVLEEALSWMRFPPLGKRGFGINPTMLDYEMRSMPEIIEHQNRETLTVVQFETVRAVEAADELLSLKGLDVMMIGPADLSIALGIPGQFDNPLLVDTVDKVIAKCVQHGVVPGIQTRGVAMAKFWAERGMRFVGVAAEHVFLLEKCKEAITALRPAKAAKP